MMIRVFAQTVAFVLASSLLALAAPAATPNDADGAYVAFAHSYYYGNFAVNPIDATQLGVHDYDDQIGDFSAAGIAKQLATDHEYLAKLNAIDPSRLSPSVALDRTLLRYTLLDDLLLNETLAQWRHNPDDYVQAASGAVFGVMSKDYAPLAKRMAFAIARERLIPQMLQNAEANVTSVDAVTQRISAEDAAGAVDFFKTSVPQAFAAVPDASLQGDLKSANASAAAAMTAYASWIKSLKPTGTFAIGAEAYRQRLLYEEGLDMPLDQYLAVGEKALAQTRAQFIAVARRINPHASPLQVYLSITRIHPAAQCAARYGAARPASAARFRRDQAHRYASAQREYQSNRDAAIRAQHDQCGGRLAGPTGNCCDASILLRYAGRPIVVSPTARRLPGAVQRLRVPDHLGA